MLAAKLLSDPDNVHLGIGFLGVALALGLPVLTGAYAFVHVSGGHFNPAVSIGLAVAKLALSLSKGRRALSPRGRALSPQRSRLSPRGRALSLSKGRVPGLRQAQPT